MDEGLRLKTGESRGRINACPRGYEVRWSERKRQMMEELERGWKMKKKTKWNFYCELGSRFLTHTDTNTHSLRRAYDYCEYTWT